MKSIFKFRKNIELDAKNWWQAANKTSYGHDFSEKMPVKIKNKIKGEKFEEVKDFLKKEIIKHYKTYNYFNTTFKRFILENEEEIIRRLEKIHGKKFPKKEIIIYYTSYSRCPYGSNGDSFWIQLNCYGKNKNYSTNAIIHELMHLFFHKYYWDSCIKKGLNDQQCHDIKEAFSVLINEEFLDITKAKDRGYKNHEKLREFIFKEWKKKKNFKQILLKAIKFYKKELIK